MKNKKVYDENGVQLTLSYVFDRISFTSINRIELIDNNGRVYTNWDAKTQVHLRIQDEERTLKVFISDKDID